MEFGYGDRDDRYEAYRRVSRVVGSSQLLGIVALLLFAAQAESAVTFLSVLGVALMIGVAAFAVGGLVGFVFGIPRSLQEPVALTSAPSPDGPESGAGVTLQRVRYAGNTSLEQISDWLTKILVGVGLTQLANIPSALTSLGETFAAALGGFAASPVVGPLEVVFFGTGGFFLGYLWTRLRLGPLLVASDEEMKAATQRLTRRAVAAVTELRKATGPAVESPGTTLQERQPPRHVLWVDDRPTNNAWEIDQLQRQDIRVTTKTSTDDALDELSANRERYGVVITDMARDDDRRAGYTLLKGMRDRDIDTPVVIYAGSGSAELNAEAIDRGAVGSTNNPIRLFELVASALQAHPPKRADREPPTPKG